MMATKKGNNLGKVIRPIISCWNHFSLPFLKSLQNRSRIPYVTCDWFIKREWLLRTAPGTPLHSWGNLPWSYATSSRLGRWLQSGLAVQLKYFTCSKIQRGAKSCCSGHSHTRPSKSEDGVVHKGSRVQFLSRILINIFLLNKEKNIWKQC